MTKILDNKGKEAFDLRTDHSLGNFDPFFFLITWNDIEVGHSSQFWLHVGITRNCFCLFGWLVLFF